MLTFQLMQNDSSIIEIIDEVREANDQVGSIQNRRRIPIYNWKAEIQISFHIVFNFN